ncbi:MAG: START domain-containing protein [Polyangia bacterium]
MVHWKGLVSAATMAVVLCGALAARAAAQDGGWEEVDDDGFAKIESRPVAGVKVREIRITATLKHPAQRLAALIGDVAHYSSFMPPTEVTKALGSTMSPKGNSGRFYIVIDPPLIHRRDYCVQIDMSKLADGRLQTLFRTSSDGCPPEKSGLVRMNRVEGSWTLAPLPDGTTRVTYQAVTDPAGTVPTWMVNRAAGGSVRGMFRALDKAADDHAIAACPASHSLGCGL